MKITSLIIGMVCLLQINFPNIANVNIGESSGEQRSPRTVTCCDQIPRLVWTCTKEIHIKDKSGNCISVDYYGDQYCTKCGTVWQTGVCYMIGSGCGQKH